MSGFILFILSWSLSVSVLKPRGSALQHMEVDQYPSSPQTRLQVPRAVTDRMPSPEALAYLRAQLSCTSARFLAP
jgi:hypothetical protein